MAAKLALNAAARLTSILQVFCLFFAWIAICSLQYSVSILNCFNSAAR